MKVYIICSILAQISYLESHIWEKSCSWDIVQNALSQSDYRIFNLAISLEQNDEKAWFFACWYRFMGIRDWLKNIGVGVFKNGCGQSVLRTLISAVCQEEMNGINGFFGVLIQIWES